MLALLFSPSLLAFPPFSPLPRDSITAHPAPTVVFHCCERMQIAIPVPGPSINSNRINLSAVIVFCASQKTLYTRAASRFAPLRTISGSYERLRTSLTDLSSPTAPCVPMVVRSRSKIGPNGPWARYNDRQSIILLVIIVNVSPVMSARSKQRQKKRLSNIASLIRRTECSCFIAR